LRRFGVKHSGEEFGNHLIDIREFAYYIEQYMNSIEEDWKPHSLPATVIVETQDENES
jgi:hypothetical protein